MIGPFGLLKFLSIHQQGACKTQYSLSYGSYPMHRWGAAMWCGGSGEKHIKVEMQSTSED